jgi:hypothetical protein
MTRPDGQGGEIPVLDENGIPVMQPGSYQDAERIWYQRNGLPVPGTAEAQADPAARAESAKEVVLTAGNAIKAGDYSVVDDYIGNYNQTGQTDDVFVSLFSELNAPFDVVAKSAEERDIPRSRVLQAKGTAIGQRLRAEGIRRGPEGDATIDRFIAMTDGLSPEEAKIVRHYAREEQDGLGGLLAAQVSADLRAIGGALRPVAEQLGRDVNTLVEGTAGRLVDARRNNN